MMTHNFAFFAAFVAVAFLLGKLSGLNGPARRPVPVRRDRPQDDLRRRAEPDRR